MAAALYHSRSFLPPAVTKSRWSSKQWVSPATASYSTRKAKRDYTSVMIVPTGVGAAIGGYAGDALPVARALSSVVDCLISHPNVLNAAMLYWPMPNVLYVEGHALDRFAEGLWGLKPVHQNRVGLVLDAGIEDELRLRHLQVADATRASLGLPLVTYTVTDTPLQVEKWLDPATGQSTGRIGHPDSLLRAVRNLIERANVNAIAVVGRFPDDDSENFDDYRKGKGVDLLAGVEAVISHLVVKEFQIPCAHAPALASLPVSQSLCPKVAAEEIGYTFLPCVLAGLSNAPQYVVNCMKSVQLDCIMASDVDSVILPRDSWRGAGALAFSRARGSKPLMIAVEENDSVLDDTPEKLGIETVKVSNYWEAIGVIAAHKSGIDPMSLRKNKIKNIQCTVNASTNGHAVPELPATSMCTVRMCSSSSLTFAEESIAFEYDLLSRKLEVSLVRAVEDVEAELHIAMLHVNQANN